MQVICMIYNLNIYWDISLSYNGDSGDRVTVYARAGFSTFLKMFSKNKNK
jgi:hypothetical protein